MPGRIAPVRLLVQGLISIQSHPIHLQIACNFSIPYQLADAVTDGNEHSGWLTIPLCIYSLLSDLHGRLGRNRTRFGSEVMQ